MQKVNTFFNIERWFGGFQASDLILIAGRPGIGKSSFIRQHIDEWKKAHAGKSVEMVNLEISNFKTVDDIRTFLSECPNLGLAVVDYLQLLPETHYRDIGDVVFDIKHIAQDLKVPIILVSQFSRDVEKRKNKQPTLSDLRLFNSTEQYADVVLFLYRESFYRKCVSPNIAKCIVCKNCRGEIGVEEFYWDKYSKFNLSGSNNEQI